MKLKDLKPGQIFVVKGHKADGELNASEFYPKKKLKVGYYDFIFGVRHLTPNPEWPVLVYSITGAKKIMRIPHKLTHKQVKEKWDAGKAYK